MSETQTEIVEWLHKQQDWLQEAALRILTNGGVTPKDLNEVAAFLKTDEGAKTTQSRTFPGFLVQGADPSQTLRLVSIGPISGIDNLAPRTPLAFGKSNLSVIYGGNGAGKSGYTRILKKSSGHPSATDLRPNVFRKDVVSRSCTISFEVGGVPTSEAWNPDGAPIDALLPIDIFDTATSRIYLNGETEATYTPGAVLLFENLGTFCDRVRGIFDNEQGKLISRIPTLPVQLAATNAGKIYQSLKATLSVKDLVTMTQWGEAEVESLAALEERLKTADPAALAKTKRASRSQLNDLVLSLSKASSVVNAEAVDAHEQIKNDAITKRAAANEGARALAASSELEDVGGTTWRLLWEAAKSYSISAAYPDQDYPNVSDDSRCVLCQQTLGTAEKTRFKRFEDYVSGTLEASANRAEQAWEARIKGFPICPASESLKTSCLASGLPEEEWLVRLEAAWNCVKRVTEELKSLKSGEVTPASADDFSVLADLRIISARLETEAIQLEADATQFDRAAAKLAIAELQGREWTSQQKEHITAEVVRLKAYSEYDKWKRWTSTTTISRKAGSIAEALITEAYVHRFNAELARLGASHIKVELVKTRVQRGKTMHRIQLKGVGGVSPDHVLSEGEHRMVVLAAFLADASANHRSAPFIFDDPISSLDQSYEERTIARLIELSEHRQVIVFTHRLSFLGIMTSISNPDQIYLSAEAWGSGEPGLVPLFAKNPEGALKDLKNSKVVQAAKVLNSEGSDGYYPLAKAICSDFRILMERVVELVLLGSVIQRHRRDVQTLGKLSGLAKITSADCGLIEEMMTKYSAFEHSQSSELPATLPTPEDLTTDIDRILGWHGEFKTRK